MQELTERELATMNLQRDMINTVEYLTGYQLYDAAKVVLGHKHPSVLTLGRLLVD